MMSDDQSRIYNSLRASTIGLLGYDGVDPLSSAQEIRISRAISLRLIVDAAQAKQLRGEVIDVKSFVAASEDLERMCGGDPETSPAGHDFDGAKEELSQLLAGRADALERRMARDPAAARREFEDKLQAAIEKHRGVSIPDPLGGGAVRHPERSPLTNNEIFEDPAGGPARHDGAVTLPALEPAATASGGLPVLVSPAPPPPPPPPASAAERARNVERLNSQPANPAPGPREAWRDYVNSDGIISPWFVPHG
jgi:hypothetical protein